MSGQCGGGWPWDSSKLKPCLQSPVDIHASTAKSSEFKPFTINIPSDPSVEFTLKLDGRTVTCKIEDKCAKRLTVCGGFLESEYEFDSINYHWGDSNELGSEHFFNGESYAGEVQIVTYKKDYEDYDTALQNEDGILIITFFLQLGKKNEKFEKFTEKLSELNKKSCIKACSSEVQWFLPELTQGNPSYYTYPGSLTTPPYTEIVTYLVLCFPMFVCPEQTQMFRCLIDKENCEPITTNRREIQPLKCRPIMCGGKIEWNIEKQCG